MSSGLNFVDGRWVAASGEPLRSLNPATGRTVWSGRVSNAEDVDRAVLAARVGGAEWAARDSAYRETCLRGFAACVEDRRDELAAAISAETGKPRWEAGTEVSAVVAKVGITLDAQRERLSPVALDLPGARGDVRRRPHGVVAVLGPFNFPAHLPGGHLVPALLAGNAVVFKPSELTPGVGEWLARAWQAAGLPPGVFNLVQGGGKTGRTLVTHPGVDGVLFTGSYATGRRIHESLAGRPEVLLALEMGGNNPLVWWDTADRKAAALLSVQSAFATAGQRCTCARRLIVPEGSQGDQHLEALLAALRELRVGLPEDEPEPYLGPVVSAAAAERLLATRQALLDAGAVELHPMTRSERCPALLTPGVIDVTALADRADEEWFGPLLQVIRVSDFEAALAEANRTAYGLSAGLLSDVRTRFEAFASIVRAGVLVWNRPTTGASGRLPFGGLGRSGNHRPSGYHTVDYCSDPVAVTAAEKLITPETLPPGLMGS